MGSVIKMYGAITGGTQDAIAQIDVPMPGMVVGVDWNAGPGLATDFSFRGQLSFRPNGTFNTNDDRGVLSEIQYTYEITTTGASILHANKYVALPNVPVMGGERLYLHVLATAAVAGNMVCLVHFSFNLDAISTRRR